MSSLHTHTLSKLDTAESLGKHGTGEAVHEVWHMILGDKKIIIFMEGFVEERDKLLVCGRCCT